MKHCMRVVANPLVAGALSVLLAVGPAAAGAADSGAGPDAGVAGKSAPASAVDSSKKLDAPLSDIRLGDDSSRSPEGTSQVHQAAPSESSLPEQPALPGHTGVGAAGTQEKGSRLQLDFSTGGQPHSSGSAGNTGAASGSTAPAAPERKPVRLYGRLEELSGSYGAVLPIKLKAMKPVLDPSVLPRPAPLTGRVTAAAPLAGRLASFPRQWAGVWAGPLKLHASQFDPSCWDFDPAEATKEQRLLQPGITGSVTLEFDTRPNGLITLEPATIIFSSVEDEHKLNAASQEMRQMMSGNNPLAALARAGNLVSMIEKIHGVVLYLGPVRNLTGVTGNVLNSQLIKNEIKELKPGVVEQVVVTWDNDRNPTSGKQRYSYSESVLRFTQLSPSQLYVQAAAVKYRNDGKFQNKNLLYGTITRGAGRPSGFPLTPGGFGQGLPVMPGGGGMPGFNELFKQLQGQF
jgi:hypothetical protein